MVRSAASSGGLIIIALGICAVSAATRSITASWREWRTRYSPIASLYGALIGGIADSGEYVPTMWRVVLIALIAEANRLYMRLALATAAHGRERNAHLMTVSAMAATFSHEIGQPLAAVTTNAAAGLSWLDRNPPDTGRAIEALRGERGRLDEVLKTHFAIPADLALARLPDTQGLGGTTKSAD